MKLQELLSKHGHDLRGTGRAKLVENYSILLLDIDKSISLSYLLFSTPFLSLLERKREPIMNIAWLYQDYDGELEKYYENDYRHHKINLVLLNTDAERIEYIEAFTL